MAVEAVVQGSQISIATVTPPGTYNAGASQNSYIKGDKGDPGPQGPRGPQGIPGVDGQDGADGAAAGFGTPTASIDANTGTPGITVTASGPDTAKVFDFAFTNLKGATGDAGPTGSDGERGGITHRITGTIQGYSTPVGNYVPAGRIAIATVISQSGASDVIVGDLLLKADYVYGVGAVDATYAYVSAGTSIKGDKGDTGNTGSTGPAGPRGASTLHVTAAPTGTPNDTYLYKIAISTVVSQSGVSPIVGDIIEYSYYHYPIAALDSTYAYLSTRISIRGAKGATGEGVPASGTTGQVLVKKSNTDYDTEWVNQSGGGDPATATPLMDGTAAVGTSTKYAREDHVHPVDTSRASADIVYVGASAPSSPDVKVWLDTDEPGMSAVSSVNGATGTVVLDADDVGAMSEWKLVWTNASPDSSFAAQTVSVDLSGYDIVIIEYGYQNTQLTRRIFVFGSVGNRCELFMVSSLSGSGAKNLYSRRSTVNTTGIEFQACYKAAANATSAGTAENAYGIPIHIYGIKGVVTA